MNKELEFLKAIDEEYLVGLTNKGIVKRAAKDLEKQEPQVEEENGEIKVRLEDAVCTIHSPVGESSCTCPQRTICKHIILSVLYLKRMLSDTTSDASAEQAAPQRAEEDLSQKQTDQKENSPEKEIVSTDAEQINNQANDQAAEKETCQEIKQPPETTQNEAWKELKTFPLKQIRKTLGESRFVTALERQKTGLFPEIKVGSIVTVAFQRENITVKLLEPVEYSTCSCHKKELCIHKAEALLCFQIWSGALNPSEFGGERGNEIDFEELHQIGKEFLDFLQERISIGLARSSPSVTESFERLATIAHNADLPEFERQFRALSEEYNKYFRRMVSFSGEQLMKRLARTLRMANRLCNVTTGEELFEIAGEFKSSYQEIADLKLAGFGCRSFHSSSGFAGTTVYLLAPESKEWYTYTSARPTYYDNQRTSYAASGKEIAPWGLECSLEELSEKELLLKAPKVNKEHRISSSSKTTGTVLEQVKLGNYDLSDFWFEDFEELFDHCYQKPDPKELDRLVFVLPKRIELSVYDKFSQCYRLPLYDQKDRRLDLTVYYTPEDKEVIKELERMEKQFSKKKEIPVFFGIAGTEEKRLTLYPLSVMKQEKKRSKLWKWKG